MELIEYRQELDEINKKILTFLQTLDLENKKDRISEIEYEMLDPKFWENKEKSTKILSESKILKKELDDFEEITFLFNHCKDLIEYLKETDDEEFKNELIENFFKLKENLEVFTLKLLLSEPYDNYFTILEIHSGAGGSDANDCAEILLKIYEKFCQKQGLKYKYINYQSGDVCGVKSVTLRIEGEYSYGLLKGEKGVHRFIRISPFDPSGKRHTSFCSVDVVPEFSEDEINIEINNEDLKIDTYKSQGAGGQHINTTDSAVRITHIPTGIVVQSQAERSQLSNKETALKELKSKLYKMYLDEQEEKLNEIRGQQKSISWGSQIKSYVFTPYTMVKDHRTNYEVATIDKVLSGEIFDFVSAYLHYNMKLKEPNK